MFKLFFKREKKHRKRTFLMKHFYIHTLKKDFKKAMGVYPDLENPKTFSEKIQWLKLHYRDPIMTDCVDKFKVRGIVADIIGQEHIIPTYGIYKHSDEVKLSDLPNEFVLKPNHMSNKVIVCTDKELLDWEEASSLLDTWMGENYYYLAGEWVYKDIPPRIICEKFLHGKIIDYKFFCFHGVPKLINIMTDYKMGDRLYQEAFYDMDFRLLPISQKAKSCNETFPMPPHFEEMKAIARKLSENFPFVRVDLYDIEDQVYFGELTFFPANGMEPFYPPEYDYQLGDMLDLDKCNNNFLI